MKFHIFTLAIIALLVVASVSEARGRFRVRGGCSGGACRGK